MKAFFDQLDTYLADLALWALGLMAVGAAVLIWFAANGLVVWWKTKGWPTP